MKQEPREPKSSKARRPLLMQPVSIFVLQQSSDLASWSAVTNAPQLHITNLQNQIALPISGAQTFYRLKTP